MLYYQILAFSKHVLVVTHSTVNTYVSEIGQSDEFVLKAFLVSDDC